MCQSNKELPHNNTHPRYPLNGNEYMQLPGRVQWHTRTTTTTEESDDDGTKRNLSSVQLLLLLLVLCLVVSGTLVCNSMEIEIVKLTSIRLLYSPGQSFLLLSVGSLATNAAGWMWLLK